MTTLLLAEVAAGKLGDTTAQSPDRCGGTRRARSTCSSPGRASTPAAREAAALDGIAKVLAADDAAYAHALAEPLAALLVALGAGLRCHRRAFDGRPPRT